MVVMSPDVSRYLVSVIGGLIRFFLGPQWGWWLEVLSTFLLT